MDIELESFETPEKRIEREDRERKMEEIEGRIQEKGDKDRLQARRSRQKKHGSYGDTENYKYVEFPNLTQRSFAEFFNNLEFNAELYLYHYYYDEWVHQYFGSKEDYELAYKGSYYGLRRKSDGIFFKYNDNSRRICVERPKVISSSSIGGKRRKKTLNKRITPKRSKKSSNKKMKQRKTKRRRH
jgi:hypothetical protein